MAGPLVATKLFIPKLRAGLVERLRLRERLKRGAHAKLTLISAPPVSTRRRCSPHGSPHYAQGATRRDLVVEPIDLTHRERPRD